VIQPKFKRKASEHHKVLITIRDASIGYTNQEGVIMPNAMERLSLRMNADQKVTDWFKVSTNLAYSETGYKGLNNGYNSISTNYFPDIIKINLSKLNFKVSGTTFSRYTKMVIPRSLIRSYSWR
jgi:hypothetical protein